jgi:hypothetical protein
VQVVFNKAINITSSNVQGEAIEIFGNEYTIGSGSTATSLILYGGAQKHTVKEGETVTITVGGVEHTVTVIGVSSSTVAVIEVDGVTKEVTEGSSYTVNGNKGQIDVYADNVYFFTKESQVSSVVLSLGSAKLTLDTGSTAKTGTDDDPIDNTLVTISQSAGEMSKLTIAVAAQDGDEDHIASAYTDPVFGTFKVAFDGFTPAEDSAARDTIQLSTSGEKEATLKFTDYRGEEDQFVFARDTDAATGTVTPSMCDSNGDKIHVVEGEIVPEDDFVVLSQGDFSHLYEVTDISNSTTSGKVTLKDVVDGSTVDINLVSPGYMNATAFIDGQTYCVSLPQANQVQVTWESGQTVCTGAGAAASYGGAGNTTTVFPYLNGKLGEKLALVNNATVPGASSGVWMYLPGSATAINVSNTTATFTSGQLDYVIVWGGAGTGTVTSVNRTTSTGQYVGGGFPAVVLLEEKGKIASGAEVQNALIFGTTSTGTSPAKMAISGTVVGTDAQLNTYGFTSSTADSSTTLGMDRYGTLVTVDSDDQGSVTAAYSDEQAFANVAIGSDPSFTTAAGGATVATAVKITNPVAKLASEVQAMLSTLDADLVLVGGPCANSLVADLAADGHVATCDTWEATYTTGVIKEVEDAFVSGKKALIIAGNTAADTRNLAAKVMQGTMSFEA